MQKIYIYIFWGVAASQNLRLPMLPSPTCVAGKFEGPPVFKSTNDPGSFLSVKFEYSDVLWPWSGFLALFIRVLPEAAALEDTATGEVTFSIISPPAPGGTAVRRSSVTVPLTIHIIPTPPR